MFFLIQDVFIYIISYFLIVIIVILIVIIIYAWASFVWSVLKNMWWCYTIQAKSMRRPLLKPWPESRSLKSKCVPVHAVTSTNWCTRSWSSWPRESSARRRLMSQWACLRAWFLVSPCTKTQRGCCNCCRSLSNTRRRTWDMWVQNPWELILV